MSFTFTSPPLNPLTLKARKVTFSLASQHGRVFLMSALSFCFSFAAWYSFPPLMKSIKADLKLTQVQVLNSNIVALAAGLCMRAISGPLCDRFGPRMVMVGILFVSAIPCGLAGTITNVTGLYLIRFFIGISGAAFVPCQVWCTAFHDKNVVGSANAIAAGWGNAGAGITYHMMPAVYDSFRQHFGYTSHVAWRLSFVVPTIILISLGIIVLLFCQDTPTGSWSTRHDDLARIAQQQQSSVTVLDEEALAQRLNDVKSDNSSGKKSEVSFGRTEVNEAATPAGLPSQEPVVVYEAVVAPSFKEIVPSLLCPQTLMLALPYACTFGGELAINSILSAYFLQHQPKWGQTKAGQVASIFGLLNVVTRPAGGIIADWLYRVTGSRRGIDSKKYWYAFLVAMQGVLAILFGHLDSKNAIVMVLGICLIAVPMDMANGSAYSLLPHVNPQINGVLSGLVGASGNFGGIMFSVGFRYVPYAKGIAIIGYCSLAIGILVAFIPSLPKRQKALGGYMTS